MSSSKDTLNQLELMPSPEDTQGQLVRAAQHILAALGMPKEQCNERSALTLLALIGLKPGEVWSQATSPLMGITPIMEWLRDHFAKDYKPNTRESIRRRTIHQFVDAGIALYNPDQPDRSVNSPLAVYQIAPEALALLRKYEADLWDAELKTFLGQRETLAARYAAARKMNLLPVMIADGKEIQLSSGKHNILIKAIIESFAPRYAPGCKLIYVGDTGDKWGYFDEERLNDLGVKVDSHGKMPDVILYYEAKEWLFLIESVTSHGPVDGKRHKELSRIFVSSKPALVYVTAFPSRSVMKKYLGDISWETEVWCADAPTHLIHFNGAQFLGPYLAQVPPIELANALPQA